MKHAWLPPGLASSTGLFLDAFRKIDNAYGVCKSPVTAGSSSGGRLHDIVPGSGYSGETERAEVLLPEPAGHSVSACIRLERPIPMISSP